MLKYLHFFRRYKGEKDSQTHADNPTAPAQIQKDEA